MMDGEINIERRVFETTNNESYEVGINLPIGKHTLTWIALYEGSYTIENLPQYVPKGYAAELAECQLYYEYIRELILTGVTMYTPNTIDAHIGFIGKKRIDPTIDYSFVSVYYDGQYIGMSDFEDISFTYSNNTVNISINLPSTYSIPHYHSVAIYLYDITLSAEL